MKALVRLAGAVTATTTVALVTTPLLVIAMVGNGIRRASAPATGWDIPAPLVPVFQEAAQAAGVPWVLLAGVGSVATDFGRHGPDGVARGATPGTSIYPILVPPLSGPSGGTGIFLLDGGRQEVTAAARQLAGRLAEAAAAVEAVPLPPPEGARFWIRTVASLPLRITDLGSDPIRRFGEQLLAVLGAPVDAVNLDAIAAWAAGEGSCAAFNPLATTQPAPGATAFNTLAGGGHVWNYPSMDAGVRATVETLLNGRYQPVIEALRAGAGVGALAAAVQGSPWGTGAFGRPSYTGRQCGPSPLTGPDAIAATIVARAAFYQGLWDQGAGPPMPPAVGARPTVVRW